MMNNKDAVALVVIGGKTPSAQKPGVDEEVELAKKLSIPVFLIGSVEGRSSEIASKMN